MSPPSSCFQEGKQVSTIRNYRSAIAAVHKGFHDGSSLGDNPIIGQLLRGMFNRRPPIRRLAPSWSINDVLSQLAKTPYEPLHSATLDLLSHKTFFLIATASGRRRSCLHALTVKPGFLGSRTVVSDHFQTPSSWPRAIQLEIFLPAIRHHFVSSERQTLVPGACAKMVRRTSQSYPHLRSPLHPSKEASQSSFRRYPF